MAACLARESAAAEQRRIDAALARERAELAALAEAGERLIRERELLDSSERRVEAEAAASAAEQARLAAQAMLESVQAKWLDLDHAAGSRPMAPGTSLAANDLQPLIANPLLSAERRGRPVPVRAEAGNLTRRRQLVAVSVIGLGVAVGYSFGVWHGDSVPVSAAVTASPGAVGGAAPGSAMAPAASMQATSLRQEIPATAEQPFALKLDRSGARIADRRP
jgi:hypothetical protein